MDSKYYLLLVKLWRPAMAWQYFLVCIFDFLITPYLLSLYEIIMNIPLTPWDPITLKAGGLYHLSMGAIVGVTAWTRSIEKIELMKKMANNIAKNDPEDVTDVDVSTPTTTTEEGTAKQ